MNWIDSHTHIYDEQFSKDSDEVISSALEAGVQLLFLPNCDDSTVTPLLDLAAKYPDVCMPMMGLHPCYVNENYEQTLESIAHIFDEEKIWAVGEVGLDYHWDLTYVAEQKKAFDLQIVWAKERELPLVIHSRKSLDDSISMVQSRQDGNLSGVFHCFDGTKEQAQKIIDLGFYIGIGGVLTFKKSHLPELVSGIGLDRVVLETDAPYLAPAPFRGKRNESSYIPLIGQKLSEILNCPIADVAAVTTRNSEKLFKVR